MPDDCGSTSDITMAAAMAASMALPPRRRMSRPASAASGWLAEIMCRLPWTGPGPPRPGGGAGEIGPDAFLERLFHVGLLERAPRHLLVELDVLGGELDQRRGRDFRDRLLVGVAAGGNPEPEEFLVEAFRLLAGRDAGGAARGDPVARRIGGVDFVGQRDAAPRRQAEPALGGDQDQAVRGGDLAP